MSKHYTSIRDITVRAFYDVLNTGDYSHLYIGEKGEDNLFEVWQNIYDEYCQLSKIDNKNFKLVAKIEDLKLKLYKLSTLLSLTQDPIAEVREAAKEALKGYNYIFRSDQPFDKELARLHNQLNVLKTKIQIEESKLPKSEKREAVNLMKEVVQLENMNPGVSIDIDRETMEKWIARWQVTKDKINAQKQARKR